MVSNSKNIVSGSENVTSNKLLTRLADIYAFLEKNREFNSEVHKLEYAKALLPCAKDKNKMVIHLMHYVVNTQSQPSLKALFIFFKTLQEHGNLDTFQQFIFALDNIDRKPQWTNPESHETNYLGLFHRLKNKPGWGEKTAALFVKAIYKIHQGDQKEFQFWDDVPVLQPNDRLYLPVDAVIIEIFNRLGLEKCSFRTINDYLYKNLPETNMDIWDDLWFWGFITQKSDATGTRDLCVNEAKLWSLVAIPKQKRTLAHIDALANLFIKLIGN